MRHVKDAGLTLCIFIWLISGMSAIGLAILCGVIVSLIIIVMVQKRAQAQDQEQRRLDEQTKLEQEQIRLLGLVEARRRDQDVRWR